MILNCRNWVLTTSNASCSNKDAEIRRRVLDKLENESNLTPQQIAEDCQRFVNVRQDLKDIKESGVFYIKRYATKNKTSHQLNRLNRRKNKVLCPLNCSLAADSWIGVRAVHTDLKKCLTCDQFGHKSTHGRSKKKNSLVKIAKTDKSEGRNIKKVVQVQILSQSIKLKLDSGSDVSIINLHTWRKLGKLTMIKTNKIARCVTWEK